MAWWRWSGPFQTIGIPRVSTDLLPGENAHKEITNQQELGETHQDCGVRDELIQRHQVFEIRMQVWVRIASRKTSDPEHVHWEERSVEPNESQEEVPFSSGLVHHPTEHFREPEVNACEYSEQSCTENNVVEVSHDHIRVMEVDIGRH